MSRVSEGNGEERRGRYHFGMFRGFPRGVVVGLLVVLDIVAVCVVEVIRGVSGVRSAGRSVVLLVNVCLLSVLNICTLLVMGENREGNLRKRRDICVLIMLSVIENGGVQSWRRLCQDIR